MKIYERDKKFGITRTYIVNPDMVISEPVNCGVCDTEHPNGKELAFCVNRAGGGGLKIIKNWKASRLSGCFLILIHRRLDFERFKRVSKDYRI